MASSTALSNGIRECLSARVNSDGPPIRYLHREAPLEVTDALRMAAPVVGDAPCIVHLGTGLLDEPLAPFVDRRAGRAGRRAARTSDAGSRRAPERATQEMLHLAEFSADHALGMAGVWLFGLGRVAARGRCTVERVRRRRPDDARQADRRRRRQLPGQARRQLASNTAATLSIFLSSTGSSSTGSTPRLRRASNNGNRIEGRVWIHEAASVHASVIIGPTVIGPGARITDSYIGPYTSIGERARVEGAEVERSIISPGASVMHVGGRLVASVVGRDARVFRDFSLPRALRLRVGDGTEVALC